MELESKPGLEQRGAERGRRRRGVIGVLDRLTWPGVPERRRRGFVIDVSLICVIVGLLWAAIALHLLQERSLAESQAELNSSNLALAFEENINRTVASIDQTLRFVRGSYLDNPNFDLARWTRDNAISNDLTFQIAIIDKDGMLRASSLGPVVKPMDLSDREHFRVHLGTSQDTLYISTPVVGRDSGKWSLQFTRKIVAPDGSFDGVVVVSLDPYMLSSFYQSLDLGRGILLLVGVDGVVRARAPVSEHMIGRVIANSPILRSTARHGSFIGRSQLDGVSRISSFRKLTRYPLIVSVGLDLADVLATYRRDKRQYVGVGTCLTFLVLIVGGLMVRHKRRLAYSQQALKDTLENISQGILMVDKHRRAPVINRRAAELLGLPPELIARVPSFDEILKWQLQSGEFGPDGAGKNDLRRFVEAGGIHERFSVYERVRPNGMVLEIRTQALPAGGAVRTFTDITERKRAEDKIRFLAHHDALTGLANRIALDDHLESAIRSISGNGRSVAVLCLDLDRFKLVNDVRGHHVGDQLLIQVANRIRQDVRECDTIARIGGDEFVIVQSIADPADAAALARRLVDSLSRPYDINGQLSMIGVSVGIALHPQNGVAAEELLKNGDTALYRAKEEGGTTFRFFHPSMNIRLYERQLLEQDLREAIAENRLTLHYQPICDTDSRQISGFEALLRWTHPVRGAIPPMEFIPMAEETGLIVPLGRWVLETACAEAATWPGDVHLAVNLSPAQFRQPDLPGLVAGILASTGMCGHRLHLEITEGLLIDDTERVAVTLTALKSQGIRISLDDFGTGHASLSYLRRFAFDKIKIDKSFVQSLGDDDEALAIAQAILTLSSTLRLGVVAEGVETELQLQVLRRLRCSQVQGYLLGRPMPAEMVRACLVPPIPSTA